MANGKYGEWLFAKKMQSLDFQVQNVSNDSSYFDKDVDFIVTSPTSGLAKTVEVKWDSRMRDTGNLYLELTNVNSRQWNGEGWYKHCQADFVAYGDARKGIFYIFPFADLKKRVEELRPRLGQCSRDSTGLLVALEDILDLASIL